VIAAAAIVVLGSLWIYDFAALDALRIFVVFHVAVHPRLGHLSAAVLVARREAASTVEAVGAIEAA
jgi:hypothetical protein